MSDEKTMLWRSQEALHVSLLGSIHMLDGPPPQWVLDASDAADILVLECVEELSPSRMPGNSKLTNRFPESGRRAVTAAKRLGLNGLEFGRQYPFDAALCLVNAKRPSDFQAGIEDALRRRRGDGSTPEALETVRQFAQFLFKEPPLEEQMRMLDQTVSRLNDIPQQLRSLVRAWRECDLGAIQEFVSKTAEFPGIFAGLYAKRHAVWASRTVEIISQTARAEQTVLIVAGCTHFVGEDSLLAALLHHGYHFQRSCPPPFSTT